MSPGECVFLVLTAILLVILIRWFCTPWWLPIKKWTHPVSFIKHKNLSIAVVVMKEKINHCPLFQVSCWNYSGFTVGKYFFCPDSPIPMFTKACFLAATELYKDTPRIHCTILWENWSGKSALWLLTAVSLVTLIWWNCSARWLSNKKWQTACFFQKTQKLDQSCGNEE